MIASSHAKSSLIAVIPDADFGWVVDLWSPTRDIPGALASHREFVAGLRKFGVMPTLWAGGHGAVRRRSSRWWMRWRRVIRGRRDRRRYSSDWLGDERDVGWRKTVAETRSKVTHADLRVCLGIVCWG